MPSPSPWISPETPAFAVVGRVNMGKSAVLATLLEIDDNEIIRVSPVPGETTRCQVLPLAFDGRECIRFIDTPGFSRPIEAMRAIQALHGPGPPDLATIARFIREAADSDFGDEKRLLEPLVDGAGILYIIDPSKPLRDDFLAEMEILRWTGRPRLALLNRKADGDEKLEAEWRSRLGAAFNLVRSFDAHHARYQERLRLLRALLDIEERHRAKLEETIRFLEDEWHTRREEAAETILGFLEEALCLRATATLEERDLSLPHRRQQKAELLKKQYFEDLASLERKACERLLKIHRHHLLEADTDPAAFAGLDLTDQETWSKWGLSRWQLAGVGAATGAAAGAAVDLGFGAHTLGAGTVIGLLGGGAAAWFKGGSLPDLRIKLGGGIKLATGQGRALRVGPPSSPNFPWILLDSMLVRYRSILARAHGRRDRERIVAADATTRGFTKDFPAERRSMLAKWFASCLKGKPDRGKEPEVFQALVETIAEAADH